MTPRMSAASCAVTSNMPSRVGRSPARPLESSTGVGRATLGHVDWLTLIASAGVSPVVGAVVSLVAVSQVTVRRARAERREAARLAVAAVVKPLQLELARYTYAAGQRTSSKRDNEAAHMDDHRHVVAILGAAPDLPAWRRRLVDRRCRRVFGAYWCDLARDYPSAGETGGGSLTAWLASSMQDHHGAEDPRSSHLHRAYATPPGSPVQDELRRELRRLAAAR